MGRTSVVAAALRGDAQWRADGAIYDARARAAVARSAQYIMYGLGYHRHGRRYRHCARVIHSESPPATRQTPGTGAIISYYSIVYRGGA